MGVYIHKSILELDLSLTLTEKLVLAYFLANKNNLKDNNVVIANRLNLTKTNVRQIIFNLKHKKIIDAAACQRKACKHRCCQKQTDQFFHD